VEIIKKAASQCTVCITFKVHQLTYIKPTERFEKTSNQYPTLFEVIDILGDKI
jgi:hypothetical protein